jgi:hypothetical protein
MFKKIKQYISPYWTNLRGWRTDRNIVVIESDDWGSIRMPSKQVYKQCLQAGYRVDRNAYERYDSLASGDDLELLFNLLNNCKDRHGNSAVITANILTANPDFEKIKSFGFQQYFYETITETFNRYPKHSNCLNLWKKGKDQGIFFPQSHGREHLNVSMFMRALQQGDQDVHFGFEHEMPGTIPRGKPDGGNKYVEALRYKDNYDKEEKLSIIVEGLKLFELLMGYGSKTFIPPNYLWSPDYDSVIASKGVQFYQGQRKMIEPLPNGRVQLHPLRLGERNSYGQLYLIRNAVFEPALSDTTDDPVNRCLKDISCAFRMNKPAIISSHRLNYVGFIDEKNRDRNLRMLERLLNQIKIRWPEVEFLTSVQLSNLMITENGENI